MLAVKEPPLSRRRKPAAAKLKLVCSFNGAFHHRPPPSGKFRYVGGETRIVSVDPSLTLSKLRSKISDLSPAIASSFVLNYQLPDSGSTSAAAPLLRLDSDEDVRRMVDAFEKLESFGTSARLWLFVCSRPDQPDPTRTEAVKKKHHSDESLRKTVLKQQLLAKRSGLVRGFGFSESESKIWLIDLDTDHVESESEELNCGNVARFSMPKSNPLGYRDENLRGDQSLGRSGEVLCNRVRMVDQSVLTMQGLKPVNYSGNGYDVAKDNVTGDLNRENIMPWGANCGLVKNGLSCDSAVEATANGFCGGESVLSSSIRNHRFGGSDARHQQCNPLCVRSNVAEMSKSRKCCLGLRPHMSIAKQGQGVRVHHGNMWRPCGGVSEYALADRARMMTMSSSAIKDRCLSGVLQHMNVNPEEYYLDCYGAFTPVDLNRDVTVNMFLSVRTMDTQENLVTVAGFGNCGGQYQTSYDNVNGVTKCEPIHCDVERETCLKDTVDGPKTAGSIDNRLPNEATVIDSIGNSKSGSGDIQDSCNGVTRSANISLRNLSLSKEVEGPQLTSHDNCVVVSGALLKPQSKPTDVMDEGQFISGPQVKESNGVASNPSFQKSAKIGNGRNHVEEVQQDSPSSLSFSEEANHGESLNCSKVIGGTSNDLAAFYTHLATRELQTIKNSDLEFIKELGSGTYGTVYHGKWKGSNVAIKKIKPSCFTDGVLEDRLLADFWKEAHILGQLHHPNIVAFYGVVTDGPMTNLATVTEYMVNGSLKQVLRRKDRTIDRRKRLILAMDAAFGMEYLHEKDIVHFDLKSHNFLVNMRDPQRPVCKIGDLGLSKIKQRTLVSGGIRGTVPWMAPELLNSNSKNNLVTEKVDVYSFGIVMWELLTGEEPYANLRSEEIIVGIIKGNLRPEIPSWCDPTWRSLMERCWSSDPDSRPAFSEISKELRAMSAAMTIK